MVYVHLNAKLGETQIIGLETAVATDCTVELNTVPYFEGLL